MEFHGPDASAEGVKMFKVAFPDLKGEVVRLITGDQEAAAEIIWRAPHRAARHADRDDPADR